MPLKKNYLENIKPKIKMPKTKSSESVLHDWVHDLPFQMQALLLTAMRGPDGNRKNNFAKTIVRYLRGVVLKPAGIINGLNDNDFMWNNYAEFEDFSDSFFMDHDEYPHHFMMHLIHSAEVVGYKHPDSGIRYYWLWFYRRSCSVFHMEPETEYKMDKRLDDFGVGFKI